MGSRDIDNEIGLSLCISQWLKGENKPNQDFFQGGG